jgi:hypothetical protein
LVARAIDGVLRLMARAGVGIESDEELGVREAWCPTCAKGVTGYYITHVWLTQRPGEYHVPAGVRHRASLLMKGPTVGEGDLVYHLTFVWVPRPGMPRTPPPVEREDIAYLGHWRRTLCGPIVETPATAWVR